MASKLGEVISGFHCHIIIKTIEHLKSTIEQIKEDEYSNSLAKIQVCGMFRAGDIRRNVLLKFIRLRMETPCSGSYQKAHVIELCNKKAVFVF